MPKMTMTMRKRETNAMWGVVEIEADPELDLPAERHIVPIVDLDGEKVPSAAHEFTSACFCRPRDIGKHESAGPNEWPGPMWNHNDPDAPGSLERVEAGIDKPKERVQ